MESDTLLVRQAVEKDLDTVLFLYTHLHEPTHDADDHALKMAGEDVQLAYAVDWIEAQAEEGTAEPSAVPTQRAAPGGSVVLAALAVFVAYLGRRRLEREDSPAYPVIGPFVPELSLRSLIYLRLKTFQRIYCDLIILA